MIVVNVELWPGGDSSRREVLGVAVIANESSLAEISSYSVRLLKGERYSTRPGEVWKEGTVAEFPRTDRRWGPWELLALALKAVIGKRVEELEKYLAHRRQPIQMIGQDQEAEGAQ